MFAYLDKAEILHVVELEETAQKYTGNGKIVFTSIDAEGGYPCAEVTIKGLTRREQIIAYDEETMKIKAKGEVLEVIPEIAALYKLCK